jgi:hypothetical protein
MNNITKCVLMSFFIIFVLDISLAKDNIPLNSLGDGNKKVLIKDVNILLFQRNKKTTDRRTNPVNQLQCIENCHNKPDRVICNNKGFDGIDAIWECESDPKGTEFDYLNVECEGYDYPDDPYILTGSCSLEYKLKYNSYPSLNRNTFESSNPIVGLCILLLIVYCLCNHEPKHFNRASYDSSKGARVGYMASRRGRNTWGKSSAFKGFGGSGIRYSSTSRR